MEFDGALAQLMLIPKLLFGLKRGVPPCSVLDEVEVRQTDESVGVLSIRQLY